MRRAAFDPMAMPRLFCVLCHRPFEPPMGWRNHAPVFKQLARYVPLIFHGGVLIAAGMFPLSRRAGTTGAA